MLTQYFIVNNNNLVTNEYTDDVAGSTRSLLCDLLMAWLVFDELQESQAVGVLYNH